MKKKSKKKASLLARILMLLGFGLAAGILSMTPLMWSSTLVASAHTASLSGSPASPGGTITVSITVNLDAHSAVRGVLWGFDTATPNNCSDVEDIENNSRRHVHAAGTAVFSVPAPGAAGVHPFAYALTDLDNCQVESLSVHTTVSDQDTSTLTITVVAPEEPTNNIPVANPQTIQLNKNTSTSTTLTGSDADTGDTLVFATTTNPIHGTLTLAGPVVTYVPATDYVGSDSFMFVVSDGKATSTEAIVSVVVNDTTPPPHTENPPSDTSGGNGGGSSNGDGGGGVVSGPLSIGYVNTNVGGGFVLGTSTEAASSEDLPAGCTPYLGGYLRMGAKNNGEDVKKLQIFLNTQLHLNLPITGVFGPMTFRAVEQFQVMNWDKVLKPWVVFGLPTDHTPTGYVYKTTKHTINLLECANLAEPEPQLP